MAGPLTKCPRCGWENTFLRVEQVAETLGVSQQTVRNWIYAERFTEHKESIPGGYRYWIDPDELQKVIDERTAA